MELTHLKPMAWSESLLFFGIPTLLLYVATHFCIPTLSQATGIPVVIAWFICGGILVFVPIFVAAFIFYRLEGNLWQTAAILKRFRLNKLSKSDVAWSGVGILSVGLLTYAIIEVGWLFILYTWLLGATVIYVHAALAGK